MFAGRRELARRYAFSFAECRADSRRSTFSFADCRAGSRRSTFSFADCRAGSRRYAFSFADCRAASRRSASLNLPKTRLNSIMTILTYKDNHPIQFMKCFLVINIIIAKFASQIKIIKINIIHFDI